MGRECSSVGEFPNTLVRKISSRAFSAGEENAVLWISILILITAIAAQREWELHAMNIKLHSCKDKTWIEKSM